LRDRVIELLKDEERWAGPYLVARIHGHGDAPVQRQGPAPLEDLERTVRGCTACGLSRTRRNLVFGEGNAAARLMFVGEAPGATEDETGRPFVGKAGELLTRIIAAMGLDRKDVYIANAVKCRPPGNRDPQPEEIGACIGYLRAQVRTIRPKVIVALGRVAAQALLEESLPIGRLRGTFRSFEGIPVMPTFHPSYLLQNESRKRDVWEDMKKVMDALGLKPAGRGGSGR
jgi:DNA polymerase